MKRSVFLIVLVVGSGCAIVWPLSASGAPATASATNVPVGSPMLGMDQRKAAYLAAIQARLPQLEKLGEVPENADELDWEAAKQTSWWGKPLDPKEFWKDRAIWLDDSASSAATRHGRAYPPMPYDDLTMRHYKDDEKDNAEGPGPGHYTNREHSFWDRFTRSHPRPPGMLEYEQSMAAETALWSCRRFESGDRSIRRTRADLDRDYQLEGRRLVEVGYPPEVFGADALFWSYVVKNRREYQEIIGRRHDTNDLAVGGFLPRLSVDLRYMTEPSEAVVSKLANAWKVAYLRRLAAEKVDSSYLNAYLKEWNLQATDVFTDSLTQASLHSSVTPLNQWQSVAKTSARVSASDSEWGTFEELVHRLEKLGSVPEDTGTLSILDWEAAQQTPWWGKPLNPQAFWKTRSVWPDDSAAIAAVRYGRAYPPIPNNDPTLSPDKDGKDIERMTGILQGPKLVLHYTEREDAFWTKLSQTHRRILESLEEEQWSTAESLLGIPNPPDQRRQEEVQPKINDGFPPEAFTDTALLWSYVFKKRQEYREITPQGHPPNDAALKDFMVHLYVNAGYLTGPTDAQVLKMANVWKIAYLRRLRSEKIHEPYMKAYLKAWNLKPEEVFANVANAPQPTR